MKPSRGVLYITAGAAHTGAARRSAASVRATNPGLVIGIFTDQSGAMPEFDWIGAIDAPHRRSKVDYMGRTPFAETLYLDSDTRVAGDLADLFRVLERFDLGIAQRAASTTRSLGRRWRHDVPAAFPQHNGGVVLYRTSPATIAFLDAWRDAYHASGHGVDQITLREALWSSDIRFAVLPPRYNARRYTWLDHWFSRGPRPVILHTNRYHPTKHGALKRRLVRLGGPG